MSPSPSNMSGTSMTHLVKCARQVVRIPNPNRPWVWVDILYLLIANIFSQVYNEQLFDLLVPAGTMHD